MPKKDGTPTLAERRAEERARSQVRTETVDELDRAIDQTQEAIEALQGSLALYEAAKEDLAP